MVLINQDCYSLGFYIILIIEEYNKDSIKEIPVEKVLDYHLGDIVYIGN